METQGDAGKSAPLTLRTRYEERFSAIRAEFESSMQRLDAGETVVRARAALVDDLVISAWDALAGELGAGVAVLAVGGYGRSELFPFSDVDLMFLLDTKVSEKRVKDPIRRMNQALWDAGLRVSAMTRSLAECEKFDPENVEFTLSLLDARPLAGSAALSAKLLERSVPKLLARERKKVVARLVDITRTRHAKYGDTLFHLEPNLKECPGGLRDAHVCSWLARLAGTPQAQPSDAFAEARSFLVLVRAFLHLRHGRDDNMLDWQIQDEAAAVPLGAPEPALRGAGMDASYWMRLYFRQARVIERGAALSLEEAAPPAPRPLLATLRGLPGERVHEGFQIRGRRIEFSKAAGALADDPENDPAHNPDTVLAIFAAIAETGAMLARNTESRLEQAIPVLSAKLEDGPRLREQLERILTGPRAGMALRAMHTLGVLELILPEFHGIDALVIRDAYHRYTVDEHTFVLIDTLHALAAPAGPGRLGQGEAAARALAGFAVLLRDLPHPALLYLAALLHDTGKGHTAREGSGEHAQRSERMAAGVVARLSLNSYESGLVLDLIRNHLEMSAALRRDVFDMETIRAFADRVQTPEALRMLTLFTYADICAVHPDALTPWKAENLWSLQIATANFLDRHVDDERVALAAGGQLREIVAGIRAERSNPGLEGQIADFLDGFPKRYLQTRTIDDIRVHVVLASRLAEEAVQLDFRFQPTVSTLTLVTRDRPMLFAAVAGVLAAWGMNIVTADAFSNAHGVVVDSFRFSDTFRTLELNVSERERFLDSVRGVLNGSVEVEDLLSARRRRPRAAAKVDVVPRIDIDQTASRHSTVVQVVAQDTAGLLRVLSLAIAKQDCNMEVALIDTEGEMAIDVFYLTHRGARLDEARSQALRSALLDAVEKHA